jgi:hypothetical protein
MNIIVYSNLYMDALSNIVMKMSMKKHGVKVLDNTQHDNRSNPKTKDLSIRETKGKQNKEKTAQSPISPWFYYTNENGFTRKKKIFGII